MAWAQPEYATAKIAVWWDMKGCPIPEGYDARRIRPNMEAAFKKLGYSGPVSIKKQTPDHLLRGVSSTGVALAHVIPGLTYKRMYSDYRKWKERNPPPATMMFISNDVHVISSPLALLLQQKKYNLFLAYSYRPYKMSVLVTCAEWLWKSLLAETTRHVSETPRHVSETPRHVLRKCSEKGESTEMFYCKVCFCDCKSLDDLMEHLSSDQKHALQERSIYATRLENEYNRQETLKAITLENFPKSKRLRKAYGTGFGHLHNHLRPTHR